MKSTIVQSGYNRRRSEKPANLEVGRHDISPGRQSLCFTWLFTWKVIETVVNEKRELDREVQSLAPSLPPHSWPITAWSGCECWILRFGKLQKWWDTALPNPTSERCDSIIGQAVLTEYTGPWTPGQIAHICTTCMPACLWCKHVPATWMLLFNWASITSPCPKWANFSSVWPSGALQSKIQPYATAYDAWKNTCTSPTSVLRTLTL